VLLGVGRWFILASSASENRFFTAAAAVQAPSLVHDVLSSVKRLGVHHRR
jgi:hypothetical protein